MFACWTSEIERSERRAQRLTAGAERLKTGLWMGIAVVMPPARHLLAALSRLLRRLSGAVERAAGQLQATELRVRSRTAQLLPAELVLEVEPVTAAPALPRALPPPIPAEARLARTASAARPADLEHAWQALTSGRNPLITGTLVRPTQAAVGPV